MRLVPPRFAPFRLAPLCLAAVAMAAPAGADTVSDAIAAAAEAYGAGNLNQAAASLTTASREIAAMQSAMLSAKFPPAPEGWTRSDNTDIAAGLGMIGGGSGAEASYTNPEGMVVTLSAYADNAMVQSFAAVLVNPQMMAMMGQTVEINGMPFLVQDGQTTMTLLENRVLVQANGDPEMAKGLLEQIDLAALGKFDAN